MLFTILIIVIGIPVMLVMENNNKKIREENEVIRNHFEGKNK